MRVVRTHLRTTVAAVETARKGSAARRGMLVAVGKSTVVLNAQIRQAAAGIQSSASQCPARTGRQAATASQTFLRGRQGRHSVCRHLGIRHRKRSEPFAQDNARAVPADRNQTAAQPPPYACAPRPIAFVNGGCVAADAAIASGVETKEAHHLPKPILHHIVVVAAQGIARQSQRIGSERRLHIVGQCHRHNRARRRLYQPRVAAKGVVAKQIGHPSSPTLVQPTPNCRLPPVCNRRNGRHTAGYKTTLRRRLFQPVAQ